MKKNIYRKLLTGGLILAALIIIAILVIPPALHGLTSMSTNTWVGWLSYMLLLAVPISLAGTYYVSSRFRQAVYRSMRGPEAEAEEHKAHSVMGRRNLHLHLHVMRPGESLKKLEHTPFWQKLASVKQNGLLWVYILAGLIYVVVAEILYLSQIGNISIEAVLILAVAFTPALTVVFVISRNHSYRVLFLAVVIHLAVLEGLLFFLGNQLLSDLTQLILVPIFALLILSNRRMRAVGPMMYVAVLVVLGFVSLGFVFSFSYMLEELGMHFGEPHLAEMALMGNTEQGFTQLTSQSHDQMSVKISEFLSNSKHSEIPIWWYIALFHMRLLGFTILGTFIIWAYLLWFANRYRQRRASDQMLEIENWWIGLSVVLCIYGFLLYGGWAILCVLILLLVYYYAIHFGFQWIQKLWPERKPVNLLLLRVFKFDKRTQRLLDSLGGKWRFIGPITLIAGTDVAHSQMEPHEFFNFTTGRLSRQFIRSEADLAQRMRESEEGSDPDGRFRIHEFFCHHDTWQFTVTALLDSADAVLMDLRGFSSDNGGCVFEIKQLLHVVPLERIQLLVDESTEQDFLNKHIQDVWTNLHISSINANTKNQQLTLIEVSGQSDASVDAIVQLLMNSAAPLSC